MLEEVDKTPLAPDDANPLNIFHGWLIVPVNFKALLTIIFTGPCERDVFIYGKNIKWQAY